MKLYLIRHGESVANKDKVFQGWTDVSLSEVGHTQAKSLGDFFEKKNICFTKIYSSPLKRAIETAQHLIQSSAFPELVTFKGLRSINVGRWAGLRIEDVKKNFNNDYEVWKSRPKEFCFPEGESIANVQKRAISTLLEILEEHKISEHNICIVTHMITIKVIVLSLLNIDLNSIWESQFTIPNTGIIISEVTRNLDDNGYHFERILTETNIPHLK